MAGSALDKYLNGQGDDAIDAEGLEYIHAMRLGHCKWLRESRRLHL